MRRHFEKGLGTKIDLTGCVNCTCFDRCWFDDFVADLASLDCFLSSPATESRLSP